MKKILLFTIALLGIAITSNSPVGATSGFNAGRIIDDYVFTNKSTMSVNDIQNFLNSKVSTCDTTGAQQSEMNNTGVPDENGNGSIQRWEWGKYHYGQTTFPCLKDYSQDGVSAAQLIYNASQNYSINPQVMIVLLQKEQGLVTDTWPLNVQYRSATGYGCPDTAACDSQYYGLTNQLNWAATMFRAILNDSPTWYTPYILGDNYIQYNPNASCGGSIVNIENRSTQALYNYTPYQPNQAALDAGWGTVNCGAYGNRNFYLYFTGWFGSTTGPDTAWAIDSVRLYLDSAKTQLVPMKDGSYFLSPNQKAYVSIAGKNIGRTSWGSDNALIGTYSPNDHSSVFQDSSWISNTRMARANEQLIAPNASITFDSSITAPTQTGNYIERYGLVIEGVLWVNNASITLPVVVVANQPDSVTPSNNILDSNQTINKGEALLSPERNSILKFRENGNLELYINFKKAWESGTIDPTADRLVNQPDGNLVLYASDNTPLWYTGTQQPGISLLKLQKDGNLVLYAQNGTAQWSTGTSASDQTNIITQSLKPDSIIFPSQSTTTPDRRYKLTLQTDGNLVLYDGLSPLWNTMTFDSNKASYLALQGDGNAVLYNSTGKPLWNSATFGYLNSNFNIQSDGNLVIYANGHIPIWQTGTFR